MAKDPTESWNGIKGYDAVAKHFGVSVKTVYYYRKKCQGSLSDAAELLVKRQKRLESKQKSIRRLNISPLWALALGHKQND